MKIYKFYFGNLPRKGLYGNGFLLVASKNKTQAKKIAKEDWARWIFSCEMKNLFSNVETPQIIEKEQHIE